MIQIKDAIRSFFHLFICFTFFLGGCLVWHLPKFQNTILANHESIGIGLVLFSFSLGIIFLLLSRGKYLHIKMGDVHKKIIQSAIEDLFEKSFSQKVILKDLEISKGKYLQLKIHVPSLEPQDEKKLLLDLEKQLNHLLKVQIGFTHSFDVLLKKL